MTMGWAEVIGLVAALAAIISILILWYRDKLTHRQGKGFLRLRASLRKGSTTALVYAWTLRWLLERVDRFFEGKPFGPDDDIDPHTRLGRFTRWLFRRPPGYRRPIEDRGKGWQAPAWSAASYDRCLLLALIYPILSALLSWLFAGQAGIFGNAIGLQDSSNRLFRLYLGMMLLLGSGSQIAAFGLHVRKGWIFLVSGYVVILAGILLTDSFFGTIAPIGLAVAVIIGGAVVAAVASAGAFVGTGTLAGAFAVITAYPAAFAVAFAVASAVAGTVASAVAGVGAVAAVVTFAIAAAVAIAIAGSRVLDRLWLSLVGLSILYFVAGYLLVGWTASPEVPTAAYALLVGLSIVPLANAPFDWLSIGLTRHLLRLGLERQRLRDRVVCWLADIGGAVLLLLGLAISMVVALEGLNAVGFAGGMSEPIAPVAATLHDIRAEPDAARHLWIYFALFSTLIPTLVHMAVILFSVLTANAPPLQRRIVRLIGYGPDSGYDMEIAILLSLRWVIAIGATAALAIGIWWIGSEVGDVWEDLLWLLIEVQKLARAVFVG